MRSDVLNLILGWTLLALLVPLGVCGLITLWLDGWVLAVQAFLPAMLISGGLGAVMLGLLHERTQRSACEIWRPSSVLALSGRSRCSSVPCRIGSGACLSARLWKMHS